MIDELEYYKEVDLPVFQNELAQWLPERIFDIHAHAWLPEHNLRPIFNQPVELTFEAESVSNQELQQAYDLLFPQKKLEYLVFGMPLPTVDREKNNRYIANVVDHQTSFGLYVAHPAEDAETLFKHMQQGGFIGLKPYLAYVTWKPLNEIRIRDFLTDAMLELAHSYHLPVMLHVPRGRRLADPDNLADLNYIARHYPKARIILAHAGRAYSAQIIREGLAQLSDTGFWLEFSNVHSANVVREVLKRMPRNRLMYGSDIPVALVRGVMLMLNGQRIALTRKPYSWSISGRAGQVRCTFMAYEQLRAMKEACLELNWQKDDIEALFYKNARLLVDEAKETIAGIDWSPH